jgi:putative tryptophan/tyrosine transport system substrate-binding protein
VRDQRRSPTAIDRRAFVCGLGAGILTAPSALGAQPAGRLHRVGVLEIVGIASNESNLSAFRQGLRELGYVEGQNLVIEYRSADGRAERLTEVASELARLPVDVIVTRSTSAALAAKQATATVPIVMASSGDPAGSGLVASLARPRGNVTGLHATAPPELGRQRLQLLKELVPGLSRVAVLWNSGDLHPMLVLRETEAGARAMGIQLNSIAVRSRWDLDRAFEEAMLGQVDALIAVEDYVTVTARARIVEFAAMSKLPVIYGLREFVEAGGLIAYGTDRRDLFRRAATYVHRILQGASPGDLPVEQPTKFELVINLKTARAIGLTIPPSLLARADQVIE